LKRNSNSHKNTQDFDLPQMQGLKIFWFTDQSNEFGGKK